MAAQRLDILGRLGWRDEVRIVAPAAAPARLARRAGPQRRLCLLQLSAE